MGDKDPTTEDPHERGEPRWEERRVVPEKLSALRQKLYLKAKGEPKFRFYALYDRIYRPDVLRAAWQTVRRNGGAPGIDGVRIDQIVSAEGEQALVQELHEALRTKSGQCAAPGTSSFSAAIIWQPLHAPRASVSLRAKNASNSARARGLKRMVLAQP